MSLPTNCSRLTSVGQASSSVRPVERLSDQAATSACTRTRLTVTSQASSSVRPVERLSEPAAASASTRTRLTVTSQASNLCDLCGKDCSDKPCLSLHIHIYHCARRDFNQASSCVRRVEKTVGASHHLSFHIRTTHRDPSGKFQCEACGKTFGNSSRLSLHSHSTHRKLSGPTLSLPTSCPRRPRWTPRRRTACCISSPTPSCGSRSPCTCCRW